MDAAQASADDAIRRLTELEIKASYTEDLLDQLNLLVYRQQEQIGQLAAAVAQLKQQAPDGGTGSARNPRDERPPHY
jgi:SlyX protein